MKTIRRRRGPRRSSFEAKLVAYSAMAGAVVAAAPAQAVDCRGGVVMGTACYTDIPDVTLTDDGTIPIDLDGDGDAELNLQFHSYSNTMLRWATANLHPDPGPDVALSVLRGFASTIRGPSYTWPGALVGGDAVGAESFGTWADQPTLWVLGQFQYWSAWGNFVGRGDRYVGFRVQLDGATTHFGWARVSVTCAVVGVALKDYAFNMLPGEPIRTSLDALTELFADGFESGDTDAWSTSAP